MLFSTDIASNGTPWYIFAAVSAAAIFVIVAGITAVSCFLKGTHKDRKRDKEPAASSVGKTSKQDLSFNNPAYSSSNDLI